MAELVSWLVVFFGVKTIASQLLPLCNTLHMLALQAEDSSSSD